MSDESKSEAAAMLQHIARSKANEEASRSTLTSAVNAAYTHIHERFAAVAAELRPLAREIQRNYPEMADDGIGATFAKVWARGK